MPVLDLFWFWFAGLKNQSWYPKVDKVVCYQGVKRFWFGFAMIAKTK
jgi:hypothetical protein